MRISPVSFKSLMVFSLKDNKIKAKTETLVRTAFNNNKELKEYHLDNETTKYTKKIIDGSAFNANSNFTLTLDKEYEKILKRDSKRVILTEAEFHITPQETEKRYFLTAATSKDEKNILNILGKSNMFYTVRFNRKG